MRAALSEYGERYRIVMRKEAFEKNQTYCGDNLVFGEVEEVVGDGGVTQLHVQLPPEHKHLGQPSVRWSHGPSRVHGHGFFLDEDVNIDFSKQPQLGDRVFVQHTGPIVMPESP